MTIALIGFYIFLLSLAGFVLCFCLLFTGDEGDEERAERYARFFLKLLIVGVITWIYGNVVFQFG